MIAASSIPNRSTSAFGRTWRRYRRRAQALGPAYFSVLVRWASWGAALAMVLLAGEPRHGLAFAVTFIQTATFTVGYFLLHRPLRSVLRQPGVCRVDGRAVWAAADLLVSLVVMASTGGVWSPFVIYALTAVMFPALVFCGRGAMLAATAFAAFQVMAVLVNGGLASLLPQQVDGFVSLLVNVYLIALFSAYLASLLRRLEAERLRTARAWRETSGLYAVAQKVLQSPPDEQGLYEQVASAVRRSLGLNSFGIYTTRNDKQALAAGYGLPSDTAVLPEGSAKVPLRVENQEVGCLVAARRGAAAEESLALLRALAGEVALGLRSAALAREKAELAAESERTRLAREIHDGVAQSLYMLMLNLEACIELSDRGEKVGDRLTQLTALARQALWEVRHYIFDLQPLLRGEGALVEILRNPLREFQTISGLPADLRSVGVERSLPISTRVSVYRVLQETLANAFKHAKASRVDIKLLWEPPGLTVEIRDDGCGFDVTLVARGYGLNNIHQRAAEVGGAATIESLPGVGTCVRLMVPYETDVEASPRHSG
jgi:signal transduction histidine kinase